LGATVNVLSSDWAVVLDGMLGGAAAAGAVSTPPLTTASITQIQGMRRPTA
jgi:hypothetical protein